MGNDKVYVYGSHNGAEYEEVIEPASESPDGKTGVGAKTARRTHWDPRIEVTAFPGMEVQIGIVPPTPYVEGSGRGIELDDIDSANEPAAGTRVMEWFSDNGQFMQLDRSGLNRLIEALQEAGASTFGRDRW